MHPISFKSTFIKPVNIEKLDSDGTYKSIGANFVELDKEDAPTLRKTIKDWKESSDRFVFTFIDSSLVSRNILEQEKKYYLPLTDGMPKEDIPAFLSSKINGEHIYALTLQEDTFTELDSQKILGFAKFQVTENETELKLLQTKPDCISNKYYKTIFSSLKEKIRNLLGKKTEEPKRPYRNIGSSIVEILKEIYSDKIMSLTPLNQAKQFYKKHEFNLNLDTYCDYVWIPPEKRRPDINYEH